ncbi:MAG: ATP-binding protein [Lachnospiraceae bacterium]|nr:ATP-binding protein [Lachnospiraceae bacterium]
MTRSDERMAKALQELDQLRLREREEAEIRQAEIFRRIPRLGEIQQELQAVAPNAISYYLHSGQRDKAKLKEHLRAENLALREERSRLLRQHGLSEEDLAVHYQCPACKDTGFLDGVRCRCLDQRLIRMSYHSSNLGEALKNQHFGVFDFSGFSDLPFKGYEKTPRENIALIMDSMCRFCEDFPNNTPANILFFGAAGTGKTFLCSCIAKALMDRGFSVLYLTADGLCSALERSRWARTEEEGRSETRMIENADLLIIDDLGTEFSTSLSSNLLINCINQRLLSQRSTLISTNLVLSGIADKYSERMISRIMGNYQLIELYGPDLRISNS